MIDTVLFDLDGTLLPMDQDEFINTYMGLLAKRMEPQGYDPRHLIAAVWKGTKVMMANDGRATNEERFWEEFARIFGADVRKDEPLFAEFYATDFALARKVCGFDPAAGEIIRLLKEKGATVALATAPLFPEIAARQRVRWAGLDPEDFVLITTYENSRHAKPNSDYYREILEKLGKKPEQCLMVGNDVGEDMLPAREAGLEVFLLTPCLINKVGGDVTQFPHGGFAELKEFLLRRLENTAEAEKDAAFGV